MHDAKGNAVTIDLTEDTTHRRFGAATLPVGRRAQLIANNHTQPFDRARSFMRHAAMQSSR